MLAHVKKIDRYSAIDRYVPMKKPNNNNNGRNGRFFYVAGYPIEERRRWPVITASPRGQCSK